MPRYATNGPHWVEVSALATIRNAEGTSVSRETLDMWTDEECTAFGCPRIPEPDAPPEGMYELTRDLVDRDGAPVWDSAFLPIPTPAPPPVPASVTNFQARAIMRQVPMPDGRSLFTTVDSDFRKAVDETRDMGEFEPARVAADIDWQAWEQANSYDRQGTLVSTLASRYELDAEAVDDLFRRANLVTA